MSGPIFNILIIDDQVSDHTLYSSYLEDDSEHTYRFHHAYTGREGIDFYQQNSVDCILLDYHLPDMDGLEILQEMTKSGPIVPVIMLTGEGNEEIAVMAMKLGAQDYMAKKFITPMSLKRTIYRASERARFLKEMEETREDLERSNSDLERFANVVAHDLKAPLRAISQHLTIVKNRTEKLLDEKTLKSIHFAVDGAERMKDLIDSIYHYSCIGFSIREKQEVDCNLVVENAKENLATVIEETSAVITAEQLPTITADPTQLLQLFQNLIGNALKFCKTAPRIHIKAYKNQDQWIFSVSDNGIGIAPEYHDKIFTIFKRLHSEDDYPGSGVGLAICERIVYNHDGKIWLESTLGQGTTFYFSLPANE